MLQVLRSEIGTQLPTSAMQRGLSVLGGIADVKVAIRANVAARPGRLKAKTLHQSMQKCRALRSGSGLLSHRVPPYGWFLRLRIGEPSSLSAASSLHLLSRRPCGGL